MASTSLPNYIRTHRKRTHLTQDEVAFLIGARSGAVVCRHERFRQTPNLQTIIAYEILFRTPVRTLCGGVNQKVQDKLIARIRLLIRKLTRSGRGHLTVRKLEALNAVLVEQAAPSNAYST
jgi:DNA-binding XRE family transcriptional regulator